MSNEDELPKDAEFPQEGEEAADDSGDGPAALPAPESAPAERGSGTGVAWLALLIALLAVAGAGTMIVQDWREGGRDAQSTASLAELRERLAASAGSVQRLNERVAELAAADERAALELGELRSELERRIELLDSLPARMSNLETSVASLQGMSAGARTTLLLAEAEYYMQLANAQLQLAGNPGLAKMALGMADDRIVQLADPALTDVRRALADELAALELLEKPDIEGATLTLSSLARVVASLPLRKAGVGSDDSAIEADGEESGIGRAWASIRRAASGLVRVTPPDETAAPLLTPDAEVFLRTNLTLQLQVARLALLRGEQAVFEQSLADADDWLRDYFDTDSAQVRGARATIDEIRSTVFTITPPDISESLRLLRQFESLTEPAQ